MRTRHYVCVCVCMCVLCGVDPPHKPHVCVRACVCVCVTHAYELVLSDHFVAPHKHVHVR